MATKKQQEAEPVPEINIGPSAGWETVSVRSSTLGNVMMVTSRFKVGAGTIYQMQTERKNPDGSFTLSQSSCFVPN